MATAGEGRSAQGLKGKRQRLERTLVIRKPFIVRTGRMKATVCTPNYSILKKKINWAVEG